LSSEKRAPPQACGDFIQREAHLIVVRPWPSQDSHRPPAVLKEKRPGPYPRMRIVGLGEHLADRVPETHIRRRARARFADRRLVHFEDASDLFPAFDLPAAEQRDVAPAPPRATAPVLMQRRAPRALALPDTPVTTVSRPSGMRTSAFLRLWRRMPSTSMCGVLRSTARRGWIGCLSGAPGIAP
jgi:hypothetical protein